MESWTASHVATDVRIAEGKQLPFLQYGTSCGFLAGYVVYGMIRAKLSNPGRFACNPTDRTEDGEYLAWVFWVFFAQKFWEFLNAVVHVLMYSHYLVTALGIKSWWRQYLTSLQLLQFCAISVQSAYAYWSGPTCGSPDFAKVLMVAYMGSMLVLI